MKELTIDNIVEINGDKRIIGHRHNTDPSLQITSQKLNNDLTMLGDKLNASFKDIKTI